MTPLVDGQATFAAMLDAIRAAQGYVYIAGWALTPAFALDPGTADGLLTAVLAEGVPRVPVKILTWSGSVWLFPPSQRLTAYARAELLRAVPQVDCRLDARARFSHCHHQKTLVVDGQVAFVGGLDLTTLSGNRWDVPGHPLRFGPNWHDVALQLEGEVVADVEANFRQRWAAVTGEHELPHADPRTDPAWQTRCQVVRTIPRRVYPFAPRGEFGIAHAYLEALEQAKHFIYLENQYIWSPEIVDALIAAMERNDDDPRFRVLLVLPARAYMGKYDNDKNVARLRAVDRGRGRFAAYTLYSGGAAEGLTGFRFLPVYVHSKVAIVDDAWYTVGSANLNQRGLATDTELNVQALDPAGARTLRLRLWAEHLGLEEADLAERPAVDVIDQEWTARAAQVAAVVAQGRGILPAQVYPYQLGRMPGSWVLQHLEAAIVEGL